MKVAVTGPSGFVGRHVVQALRRRDVSPMLALRPGSSPPEGYDPNLCVALDVHAPPDDAFQRLGEPDVLIHLAWDGLPNYKSPHHLEHELPAQSRFLASLVRQGLRHLVVTGTCAEYGMQSGELREELETRPPHAYGEAKDALLRDLERLQHSHPFALTWARLFYMHGDGQHEKSLLPQLKAAVDRGEKSFNMSGGEQQRDYLPVTEVAELLVTLALEPRNDGIVNVCSGTPITVRRLVEEWISANGWDIELNLHHYPYPDYEPMAFWGDRSKLNRCLGARGGSKPNTRHD